MRMYSVTQTEVTVLQSWGVSGSCGLGGGRPDTRWKLLVCEGPLVHPLSLPC